MVEVVLTFMTSSPDKSPVRSELLRHDTPFFLFSRKEIAGRFDRFRRLFPGADIHYAVKANSEPEILETLHGSGSNFEIASVGELELLQALGIRAERIIFGSSVKSADQVTKAFAYGVDRFACDSFQELEKIARCAPGSRVYVRAAVNESGSVFQFSEKFGTDKESIPGMFAHAAELGLRPYGVSFHVGSQAGDPMAWANALSLLHDTIKTLNGVGFKLEILNIGGGFPCRYASAKDASELSEIAGSIHRQYRRLSCRPKLILEPGRGIIAPAGKLVASVIARVERKGKHWLFLDAGVYNALFEAMAYQGSTRYTVTSMKPANGSDMTFALAGPTGDSPDVITREASLPADISEGDRIIFHDVGAYSLSTSSRFNGFPKPALHMV